MPNPVLTIAEIAPDDEGALRAWFDAGEAARAVDRPDDPPHCWVFHRGALATPWRGEPCRAWLARRGSETVGVISLSLPDRDNRGSAFGDVLVVPGARGRGLGRALLGRLVSAAREAGRTRIVAGVAANLDGSGVGLSFARAVGGQIARSEVQRALTLPTDPRAVAHPAPGYRLVTWRDPTPDEWVDDVARLAGRMSTDSPQGDLDWEPEVHDADRVRERDELCRARGVTLLTAAAVAADGHLAGYTELGFMATGRRHGQTWNTLVLPEHRGHGIGMWVKLANLAAAHRHRPELQRVTTWNAESNRHMIAINEAIGFRPSKRAYAMTLALN